MIEKIKEKAEELRLLNILVMQHGKEIARFDWDEEIRRNIYSATKSFTSAAVGLAVKEGLISLEEKVSEAFAAEMPENPPEALLALKVRDLLTMCAGQEKPLLMGPDRLKLREKDWVRYALAQPFAAMPGEKFLYSNTGPYLAGVLVQRRSGCSLVNYLGPRLFDPLGINYPTWETDPQGNNFGAGGLFLSISEFALFGQLYLQEGNWRGKQILTAEWIKESTSKQVESTKNEYGYGYLFWRDRHNCYYAGGKYEQYSMVFPDKDAVIAVLAENHKDGILDLVLDTVVPGLLD